VAEHEVKMERAVKKIKRTLYYPVNCAGCGADLYRKESEYRKHKKFYCSNDCMKNGRVVKCDNCGRDIYKINYWLNRNANQFCDFNCSSEWFKTNRPKQENAYQWQGGDVEVKCEECGSMFIRSRNFFNVSIKKKRKMFCSHKCQGSWFSKHMTGENSPIFGTKQSPETLKKLSIKRKGLHAGSKHPNWKGGIGNQGYPDIWTNELRMIIRNRDGFKCQVCGDRAIVVHHIDYNKDNCKVGNLITLCTSCHPHTNYSRFFWESHFKYMINNMKIN
jgi:hypothetical protein